MAADRAVYSSEVNYDEAIMAQVDNIQKEISDSQALVSEKEDIMNLLREYSTEDYIYQSKIENLSSKYCHVRRTRGDGNCFFRAFGYGYLERLIDDKLEYERFKALASKSKDELVALGFPVFTIEDFHDVFMEVIEMVGKEQSTEELLKTFQDEGVSNYIVVYLRLLTSAQLQKRAEFFENFIEGGRTVKEFCSQPDHYFNIHASGVPDFRLDHTAFWVGGLRKVGINFQSGHIGFERSQLGNFINPVLKLKHRLRLPTEESVKEVEPMAKESDHIHIIALTDALGVCIRVEYVDRTGDASVNHHDFPEDGGKPHVNLLYRPGHYDVLYKGAL